MPLPCSEGWRSHGIKFSGLGEIIAVETCVMASVNKSFSGLTFNSFEGRRTSPCFFRKHGVVCHKQNGHQNHGLLLNRPSDWRGAALPGGARRVDTETKRETHRETETQRHRDTETQRHRGTETQRRRDAETQRHRDTERETQRHSDTDTETQTHLM